MTDGLLSIGRFARLCRLSVKQLRHYDELGLLAPAWVDPDSGYRYYRSGQARDALSIGLLRSLDVPLPAIGRVLSGDDLPAALGEVRAHLDADLRRRRRALASLDRLLAEGLPNVEVTVTEEPARRVATARDVATPDTIGDVVTHLVTQVPRGLVTGLFPLDLTDEVPITVAVEDPSGDDVLPGGTFASATHVGPYDQIGLTHHALLAWCGDRGHTPRGPSRELYLTDPMAVPPERLVTQLMIELEDL